jgi:hypothetical protein
MKDASQYSALDRLLHGLALEHTALQIDLAKLENAVFRKQIEAVELEPPVFVTAMPRAGTTVLLQLLSKAKGVSSQTYRDMPFVLCPLLWRAVSTTFSVTRAPRPRGHDDGILIDLDSVEAFEEVVWRAHWPAHYRKDGILLWQAHEHVEGFESFFARHMRKVVAFRTDGAMPRGRYLSKNNANIARIGYLRTLFPRSVILVPFRHPREQAASLLRQHLRSLSMHTEKSFSRRYVEWLGHFEFGLAHRPFAFPSFSRDAAGDSRKAGYWLHYWVAAYEYLLAQDKEVAFISYEQLCRDPGGTLRALSDVLPGLPDEGTARALLKPYPSLGAELSVDPALLARADEIFQALRSRAINVGNSPS